MFEKMKEKREAELFFETGNRFFEEKNYLLAAASFETALSKNPNHAAAACNAGFAHHELGRYESAVTQFDRALEIDPKMANARYGKGNALTRMGKYEEAIAEFDKALSLRRNFPKAWHNRGYALHKLGREDEAMQCIQKKYECMGAKNCFIVGFSWEEQSL